MATLPTRASLYDMGNGVSLSLESWTDKGSTYAVRLGRAYIGRAYQFEANGQWRLYYRDAPAQMVARDFDTLAELDTFLITGKGGF